MSDAYDVINEISSNIFKALIALNSGAFFAIIHFWSKDGGSVLLNNLYFHPAYLFSLGLTSVLLFAAANYCNGIFYQFSGKLLFWLCFILSIFSAIFFISGCWSVAYALAQ